MGALDVIAEAIRNLRIVLCGSKGQAGGRKEATPLLCDELGRLIVNRGNVDPAGPTIVCVLVNGKTLTATISTGTVDLVGAYMQWKPGGQQIEPISSDNLTGSDQTVLNGPKDSTTKFVVNKLWAVPSADATLTLKISGVTFWQGAVSANTVTPIDPAAYPAFDQSLFLKLAGRSGGQVAYGGTSASENMTLDSTSHATKGRVIVTNLKLAGSLTPAAEGEINSLSGVLKAHDGTSLKRMTLHSDAAPSNAQILVHDGTKFVPVSVSGDATISNAGVVTVSGRTSAFNYLCNSGCWFDQRHAAGSGTTIGDGSYGGDRWKMQRRTTGQSYTRISNTTPEAVPAPFYARINPTAADTKIAVYQVVEGKEVNKLQGKTVVVQAWLRSNQSIKARLALWENAASGTVDQTGNWISSFSSVTGTDPTLATTGGFTCQEVAPVSVPSGASGSIVNGALDCSLTPTWTLFAFTATVPSNSKNLAVAIYSDAEMLIASTHQIDFSAVGLYNSSVVQTYDPQDVTLELIRCQRFYEKSYSTDTNLGDTGTDVYAGAAICEAMTTGTGEFMISVPFKVAKRIVSATITTWDSAGTSGKGDYLTSGSAASGKTINIDSLNVGTAGFRGYSDSATNKSGVAFHWSADAEF